MNNFAHYLTEKGLSEKSIRDYLRSSQATLSFLDCPPQQIGLKHLQLYIRYLQSRHFGKRYINEQLRALRHYFQYLRSEEVIAQNPAQHLHLRGVPRPVVRDFIPHLQLREALEQYQKAYPKDVFRQAALSLMIYQGAATGDLSTLEKSHLDLNTAQIRFPGSVRTAPRSLALAGSQILLLQDFLQSTENRLFLHPRLLSNRLSGLFKSQLPRLPAPAGLVQKAQQIRASVLHHWLKQEDIRRVQYKAGHRYISSTEAYQQEDLEALQEDLNRYHPLNQT